MSWFDYFQGLGLMTSYAEAVLNKKNNTVSTKKFGTIVSMRRYKLYNEDF